MSNFVKDYFARMDIPLPTLSLTERKQRRYAYRNERSIHKRKCDLTGEQIISMYHADHPFPVYSQEAWYSDKWNPLDYGQDFDFNRPFFDQFFELQKKVPRIASILVNNINCDYGNLIGDSKNCYLCYASIYCEDCMYGTFFYCKDSLDCLLLRNSELCYECVDCEKLYECFYCQDCQSSRNLWYCYDVASSQDCFLCVGLRHGKYQIFNQKYSKDDYFKRIAELKKKPVSQLRKMLLEFRTSTPVKHMVGVSNENVIGDHLNNCKNSYNVLYSQDCEEVYNSTQIFKSHHIIDSDFGEFSDYVYENSGYYRVSNLFCCHWCWEASNMFYCSICTSGSSDCFGCISLKKNRYCILNKQYSKEEYEALVPRIIAHMKKTGEWGQFFPTKYSMFAYNESAAQDYYPLSKDEALSKGWQWNDVLFSPLKNVEGAIKCEKSGRLFKPIREEMAFYQKHGLPVPTLHPDERYKIRLSLRNPRRIRKSLCNQCSAEVYTTFKKESRQIIYCEKCYLDRIV